MRKVLWIGLVLAFWSCSEDELPTTPTYESYFLYENIESQRIQANPNDRYTDPSTNLEYTGWGVYEDIQTPNTTVDWLMSHTTQPALQDTSLKCQLTGGDQYNNAFYTNTIALKEMGEPWAYEETDKLVFEADFFINAPIDCQSPNFSYMEGIEFTFQQVNVPLSYGFGLQWSKGGEWRYWNDEKDPNTAQPLGWTSFTPQIYSCVGNNEWHNIKIEGDLIGEGIAYSGFSVDNFNYNLNDEAVGKVVIPPGWVENFIQVGMQINGNKATDASHGEGLDPVTVYIDNVTLEGWRVVE